MQLVIYDTACRAIAAARSIDEVKEISNRAEAARAYAKQAKNRQLEIDALEIRTRAERRLGEIILGLKAEGVGKHRGATGNRSEPPLRLQDLDITGSMSASSQRLANLPEQRFESELAIWRAAAPNSAQLVVPLQHYRYPTIRTDRAKQRLLRGVQLLHADDPFARFRAPDGRRIADWRVGELDRLEETMLRLLRIIAAARSQLPVVHDPIATIEMVLKPQELSKIFDECWQSVDPGDNGLRHHRATKNCEHCGADFLPSRPSKKQRSGETAHGRFCSRLCVGAWRTAEAAKRRAAQQADAKPEQDAAAEQRRVATEARRARKLDQCAEILRQSPATPNSAIAAIVGVPSSVAAAARARLEASGEIQAGARLHTTRGRPSLERAKALLRADPGLSIRGISRTAGICYHVVREARHLLKVEAEESRSHSD